MAVIGSWNRGRIDNQTIETDEDTQLGNLRGNVFTDERLRGGISEELLAGFADELVEEIPEVYIVMYGEGISEDLIEDIANIASNRLLDKLTETQLERITEGQIRRLGRNVQSRISEEINQRSLRTITAEAQELESIELSRQYDSEYETVSEEFTEYDTEEETIRILDEVLGTLVSLDIVNRIINTFKMFKGRR